MKQVLFAVFCLVLFGCVLVQSNDESSGATATPTTGTQAPGDNSNSTSSTSSTSTAAPNTTPAPSGSGSSQNPRSTVPSNGTTMAPPGNTTAGSDLLRGSCFVIMAAIPLQRILGTIN